MIIKIDAEIKLVDYIKQYAIIIDSYNAGKVDSYSQIPEWFKLSEDGSLWELKKFDLPPDVVEINRRIEARNVSS